MNKILVEVSVGELLDKISILLITKKYDEALIELNTLIGDNDLNFNNIVDIVDIITLINRILSDFPVSSNFLLNLLKRVESEFREVR